MNLSPTTLRWLAVPLGLIAFAGRPAIDLIVEPRTFHLDVGWGLAALGVSALAVIGFAFGTFALFSGRRRPEALVAHGTVLAALPSPLYAGTQAILLMWFAGGLIVTQRVPDTDVMRIATERGAWILSAIGAGLLLTGAAAFLLIQRPRVEFDAEGLTIRRIRTVQRLEWDRLAHGGPLPPSRKRARYLKIYLDEPPLLGTYPPSVDVPIDRLHIDPAFLADTIRRYVEHPEQRAALPGGGKPQGAPST